jgi:hypothetical protein
MIPRVVHFVFGLRPQREPFHLLHYLAIESCRQVVRPDEIRLHLHELPYGIYWDLARPLVTVERVQPVPEIDAGSPELAPYRYAHHADVIRLDVLARDGGMYADIDTLFVRPVPEECWAAPAVIGEESAVQYDDSTAPEPSMSNALLMAEPGAPFITTWRSRIIEAMDGSWSAHSCRLATRLAAELPDEVRIEPESRFSPYPHTPEGVQALLEHPLVPGALDDTASVHLLAHLWWDRDRRDFARYSAHDATESALRTGDTPLARLAQPFLPDHGLFG